MKRKIGIALMVFMTGIGALFAGGTTETSEAPVTARAN